MFDFLFKDKGEEKSVMELITVDVKKLELAKTAIEKAENMIAKAIAKSEFVVQRGNERVQDDIYWMLNIRPNSNETATDFWMRAIKQMLREEECVICVLKNGLFIADSYSTDNSVTIPQVYKNITISANGKTMKLNKNFSADDIIHLRAKNRKIRGYLEKTLKLYNDTVSALCAAKKVAGTPKFALNMEGHQPVLRTREADGSERQLTIDEYKKNIKTLLESDDIEVLTNSTGLKIEQMTINTSASSEDIAKLANEIFTECASAYDIPKAVFLGEITEKADSTNEFITYAVSWIVEIINDSLNAKMVGKEDYLKGEKIWVDISQYKHIDIVQSAANLDKLRSIGFSFDEILTVVGWEPLNTDFSRERVVTKNYTNNLGGDADDDSK